MSVAPGPPSSSAGSLQPARMRWPPCWARRRSTRPRWSWQVRRRRRPGRPPGRQGAGFAKTACGQTSVCLAVDAGQPGTVRVWADPTGPLHSRQAWCGQRDAARAGTIVSCGGHSGVHRLGSKEEHGTSPSSGGARCPAARQWPCCCWCWPPRPRRRSRRSRTRSAATAPTPTCGRDRRARTSVTSSSCTTGRSCASASSWTRRITLSSPTSASAPMFTERVPPGPVPVPGFRRRLRHVRHHASAN